MRKGVWLSLALCLSFPTVASAGAGVWTTGGPYGGEITALAVDPRNSAIVYAGTPRNGVFKSTDSGNTWIATYTELEVPGGQPNLWVSALAINPSNTATIYVGTYGGILKTTNSGGTWAVAGDLPGEAAYIPLVVAIAIDPTTPSTVYVCAYARGVFKSTDSGATWSAANMGLPPGISNALLVDPASTSTIYVGTGSGVYKSVDAAATWTRFSSGLTAPAIWSLAITRENPPTLFAATIGGGIFRSVDSGNSWDPANSGLTDQRVLALATDPSNATIIYAATLGGVFRSTDSASSWNVAGAGMYGAAPGALAVDPGAPSTLYAGTQNDGVFRSLNSAATWAPVRVGLTNLYVVALAVNPADARKIYAAALNNGVFVSADSGGTWTALNHGLTNLSVVTLAIDPRTPSTLYAGTEGGGLFKTTNGGGLWTPATAGLFGANVYTVIFDPTTSSTLYAVTGEGLFRSADGGNSWSPLESPDPAITALVADPTTPGTLYAGTFHGVFKSTDAGGTWAAASTGLTGPFYVGMPELVLTLALDPKKPATIYAGTLDGVFKTTDSGATWKAAVGLGGPYFFWSVRALAIDPESPGTVYAGMDNNGVSRSTDFGETWSAVNGGLPDTSLVSVLAVAPTAPATVHAGLAFAGVWQSTSPRGGTVAILPTSAHTAGAGGAFFTTDVAIANVGDSSASFTLRFLGSGEDGIRGPETTARLAPGQSVTYVDVLASVFNQSNAFGAIRITSATPMLDVVSVTSTSGFGGTFGQAIPAVPVSDMDSSERSILYVREGDGYRTNLVLANNDGTGNILVDVLLKSAAGETLATKVYSVPPSGMTQINRVVRDMGIAGPVTGARLVLSSFFSAPFTGLVSVIDEATNDSTAVLAQRPTVSGSAPFTWLLPSSAHSTGLNGAFYSTNLAVANVGAAQATFTLKFLGHGHDGSTGPEQTFNLEAGKSVTYFDVLGSVFHEASNFGAIRISSDSPFLNFVSVTSTPGFGGTFGQTISAVFSGDLVRPGSTRSILGIREGDGFRTNLVLASGAGVSTNVDVTLVSPEGAIVAATTYTIPPNGMTQINRVIRDMGSSSPLRGSRLVLSTSTTDAAFTAFASVIDDTTNDPIAVEAR